MSFGCTLRWMFCKNVAKACLAKHRQTSKWFSFHYLTHTTSVYLDKFRLKSSLKHFELKTCIFFVIRWRPIGRYFELWKLVACWWQVYNCRPAAPSPLCPVGAFIQSSWNWLQLAFRLGQTYIGFVYTENTIDNNSKWYVLCHFQTGPLYVQVGILESEQFRQ